MNAMRRLPQRVCVALVAVAVGACGLNLDAVSSDENAISTSPGGTDGSVIVGADGSLVGNTEGGTIIPYDASETLDDSSTSTFDSGVVTDSGVPNDTGVVVVDSGADAGVCPSGQTRCPSTMSCIPLFTCLGSCSGTVSCPVAGGTFECLSQSDCLKLSAGIKCADKDDCDTGEVCADVFGGGDGKRCVACSGASLNEDCKGGGKCTIQAIKFGCQ